MQRLVESANRQENFKRRTGETVPAGGAEADGAAVSQDQVARHPADHRILQKIVRRRRGPHQMHRPGLEDGQQQQGVDMAVVVGGEDQRPSAFDKGDVVKVRLEEALSVVVLPTHQAPDPDDVPEELPEVFICCVPIALVRTPIEGGDLRWVEVRDLTRMDAVVAHDTLPPREEMEAQGYGAYLDQVEDIG